ncbi:acyltransferase [Prauserella marina]|uniref:Peptidoglycan/LPS O-acetylase OafA/YrhL, contains acyltransferase and SGNH-hydrolase domains n=2 Tax=Prauserella marina TaxID=530584 RepID=A0A222VTG3_9PSEU|nr:acyltransferase [Prauserella marina]ASR37122.1 acyltransferase [Prauserella marina]PWV72429.1 peptidoglycan/LPS O-acetylase OafA/YrhL [Prauserella marina]SDD80273.1 Peptidoglycan/LPS O-acetylase OafA/YrhL, contains acyltransferase and SGNH-hydrolase domains [Prauserella marina]
MSWDVIRVVAIFFVIAGHVTGLASRIPGIEGYPFSLAIPFGTVTLLVLSGYFIGPTIRKGDAGRWLRARLSRLLPAYLVAVLLTYCVTRYAVVTFNGWWHQPGVLGMLFGDPVRPSVPTVEFPWHVPDLNDLLLNVLLLHEWNPDLVHRIDGSYWTLPVQVIAFVCAALLWRSKLRHRVRPHTVLWAVTAISAASPLLSLFMSSVPTATGTFYGHLFAAGMAIWLWQHDRLPSLQLVMLLSAAVGLHALRASAPEVASVIGLAVMLVLMCLAAKGPDWDVPVVRLLRRPISWLAGISFGLYLVHQQLGYVLARWLSEAGFGPWWLRLTVIVTAVVVAAWLLTVLVERPAYRVLTRPRTRGTNSAVAVPTRANAEPAVSVGGAT